MSKRAETFVFWTPLVVGLVAAAIVAHGLTPLGVALLLGPPVLAAITHGAGDLLRWLVGLVLAAQVFLGAFVLMFWVAVTVRPARTAEGYGLMPTGQLALAILAGSLVTLLWALARPGQPRAHARPRRACLVRGHGRGDRARGFRALTQGPLDSGSPACGRSDEHSVHGRRA
jgi:hypothetical protein